MRPSASSRTTSKPVSTLAPTASVIVQRKKALSWCRTGVLVTAIRPPARARWVAAMCRPSAARPATRSSGSQ
jgi:hypothetical protein